MASSSLRTRPDPGSGAMHIDALYEILLRIPAKELCRLRAVCRPWRSLLSDPHFIAAHAARHPGPFIVAGHDTSCRDDGILCDIINQSGRVIKQIRSTGDGDEDEWVISAHLDFACIAKGSTRRCQLLNLATGDVFTMPEGLSEEHTPRKMEFLNYRAAVAFGKVASTGEYKLLRVIDNGVFGNPYKKLCEVFTLGCSGNARWRGKAASPDTVDMRTYSRVVIDAIVYFFLDENQDVGPRSIASFDLSTEEWRVTIRGPVNNFVGDELVDYDNLSLATLSGSLVVVHRNLDASMDLWFLMDFDNGLWVKQHTMRVNLCAQRNEFLAHPLLILNDGRIVTYIGSKGILRIYNPRTNTCTDAAELGPCIGIGLYSGNLLSLPNGAT
ncbi:hypothetical protein BAE44_0017827 [Dichanthelium oligosanthes]|uniref:F-box domain-containing protein n=1 Tax=Dichanthelium oligosanthes TaxID=888268 RepID=A0A1E5V7K5_9POAL|nr:hypothetical protein BAE44_0017827 [Dichanthelium oligosanthes]